MGVVPDDVIKGKDDEIAALIKEIGDLANELKAVNDEEKRTELVTQITEKEKALRAVRQKKAQYKGVVPQSTPLW
jgi:uncharacterized protein YoxC